MNAKLERLNALGCDVASTLPRLLNSEDFMLHCVSAALQDQGIERLGTALAATDASAGFFESHTLKGVFATTGLTPLLDLVNKIVEPCRAGSAEGLDTYYQQLLAKRDEIAKALDE